MAGLCRGENSLDPTCNNILTVDVAPAVDIGTLLLLNKEDRIFKGDLDINYLNGSSSSSLLDIPFGGPIDINSPLVTSFMFTVKEYYNKYNTNNL